MDYFHKKLINMYDSYHDEKKMGRLSLWSNEIDMLI